MQFDKLSRFTYLVGVTCVVIVFLDALVWHGIFSEPDPIKWLRLQETLLPSGMGANSFLVGSFHMVILLCYGLSIRHLQTLFLQKDFEGKLFLCLFCFPWFWASTLLRSEDAVVGILLCSHFLWVRNLKLLILIIGITYFIDEGLSLYIFCFSFLYYCSISVRLNVLKSLAIFVLLVALLLSVFDSFSRDLLSFFDYVFSEFNKYAEMRANVNEIIEKGEVSLFSRIIYGQFLPYVGNLRFDTRYFLASVGPLVLFVIALRGGLGNSIPKVNGELRYLLVGSIFLTMVAVVLPTHLNFRYFINITVVLAIALAKIVPVQKFRYPVICNFLSLITVQVL